MKALYLKQEPLSAALVSYFYITYVIYGYSDLVKAQLQKNKVFQ